MLPSSGVRTPRRRAFGSGVLLWGAGLLAGLAACGGGPSSLEGTTLVPRGGEWRVSLDPASGEPASGRSPAFADPELDDASWSPLRAPLGFDQDGMRSELPIEASGEPVVVFLRHRFEVPEPGRFDGLVLELRADDGAHVFLNGQEVARSNLPGGEIDAGTLAELSVAGAAEEAFVRLGLPLDRLREGSNLLAVSLHNTRAGSDLVFDAALVAQGEGDAPELIRGPYLQQVTSTSARVRFETSRPALGVVRYGTSDGALDAEVRGKKPARAHDLALRDLLSGTTHAYRVELGEEGVDGRFRTAPRTGSRAPFRVWVTGDLGTGSKHARAVRDGFARFTEDRPAQVWITLGDNAYPSGTPMDWQARFFDVYPEPLRSIPFFPSIGNHDANAVSPLSGRLHYFEALTLPTRAEAGGSPSGSEHFYSFDWGNAHFIALDSDQSDRRADAAMARWLRLDLLHTQADWKIAYLHHAPFSRGTHHDDREKRARQIRENFVPILEEAGVDLVLSGHSHAYERSHWLAGPHPEGWHFDPGRVLSEADASGDLPVHRSEPGVPRGTLYVVAGSAGQIGRDSPLDHPSMAFATETHGSLVLDVEGCSLEGRFVDVEGAVLDAFRLEKQDRLGTCKGGEPAARTSPGEGSARSSGGAPSTAGH